MSEEMLSVVDEDNQPIAPRSMEEVYAKKLHHRIAHVMLLNEKDEILMQQRSANKSYRPLAWMHTAGGHVQAGESYQQAGERELKEELGISTPLQPLLQTMFPRDGMKKFSTIFVGHIPSSQSIQMDANEVGDWRWVPITDLTDFLEKNDVLEESRFVLQLAVGRGLI